MNILSWRDKREKIQLESRNSCAWAGNAVCNYDITTTFRIGLISSQYLK